MEPFLKSKLYLSSAPFVAPEPSLLYSLLAGGVQPSMSSWVFRWRKSAKLRAIFHVSAASLHINIGIVRQIRSPPFLFPYSRIRSLIVPLRTVHFIVSLGTWGLSHRQPALAWNIQSFENIANEVTWNARGNGLCVAGGCCFQGEKNGNSVPKSSDIHSFVV